MAYLDQTTTRADPRALAGVIAIHGAMGALLISGLAVTGVIDNPLPRLEADNITIVPAAPPKPDEVKPAETVQPRSEVFVPKTPITLDRPSNPRFAETEPTLSSSTIASPAGPNVGVSTGHIVENLPLVLPEPIVPKVKPTRPIPRGDPGGWVTTEDYRSRWVNEGLTGTARFRLSVSTDGRVSGCQITRSTGHAALDSATCQLIQRRARFTPSKDGVGKPVAGTYENAVVWRLPD